MKHTLVFKSPDAVDDVAYGIEDDDERAKFQRICSRFVEFGEYVRIVIDTDLGTATVKEVGG